MKTKTKILPSQRDFQLLPEHKETPYGVSLTVPDESLSIRELLSKHTTGYAAVNTPVYNLDANSNDFDTPDLEKINSLDLHERELFTTEMRQRAFALNEQARAETEQAKKDALLARQKQAEETEAKIVARLQAGSKKPKRNVQNDEGTEE